MKESKERTHLPPWEVRCRKRWFKGFPMRKRLVSSEPEIRAGGCAVKRELHQLLYTRFSPNPNLALWSRSKKRSTRRGGLASNGELMFILRFCWWVWVGYAGSGDDEVEESVEVERVVEARETPVEGQNG